MLKKANRIQNRRLLYKLGKDGKTYRTENFIFKYLVSDLSDSEFAVSISKKVSAKAVVRNKTRRQTFESLRKHLEAIPKPIVCLIIRKNGGTEELEYNIIDAEVLEFIKHLSS